MSDVFLALAIGGVLWYIIKYGFGAHPHLVSRVGVLAIAAPMAISVTALVFGIVVWTIAGDCPQSVRDCGAGLTATALASVAIDYWYDADASRRREPMRASPGICAVATMLMFTTAACVQSAGSACADRSGVAALATLCMCAAYAAA